MNTDLFLRQFYDIMVACGSNPPPWEQWRVFARANAELWPIEAGGKMVGGVFFKGHTIHIAILPEWHGRWLQRKHLRAWRQFEHAADLYATPEASNTAACELARRLGFRLMGVRGQSAMYVKERTVRMTTEEPCLQP
jgi:ribosomal protein S18 acetylase RimI-like enzyme